MSTGELRISMRESDRATVIREVVERRAEAARGGGSAGAERAPGEAAGGAVSGSRRGGSWCRDIVASARTTRSTRRCGARFWSWCGSSTGTSVRRSRTRSWRKSTAVRVHGGLRPAIRGGATQRRGRTPVGAARPRPAGSDPVRAACAQAHEELGDQLRRAGIPGGGACKGYRLRGAEVTVCKGLDGAATVLHDGRELPVALLAEGEERPPDDGDATSSSGRSAPLRARSQRQADVPSEPPTPDQSAKGTFLLWTKGDTSTLG